MFMKYAFGLTVACLFISLSIHASVANRTAYTDSSGILRWRDDDSEVALFGVNYYTPFSIDFKGITQLGLNHKSVIDSDVAHFARLGLDAIRLHLFDREISDAKGNLLANKHLDLFDYLVARCKERGIYTVLTPIAWWSGVGKTDGFSNLYTKPQMVLEPAARRAQVRYLKQFMQHVNPYTHLAYKDEPAIVAIELINEPIYSPDTTEAQVINYINSLVNAVRSTGAKQPIFYNGWDNKESAIANSKADGCTFSWYPTGLVAGHSLKGNYLPRVDDYPRMRLPVLAKKAKIVYEFDAADVPGRVMYPAMARSFRSGGAQIATQFQYDPTPLAHYNYGWVTHYLNLIYAPGKTISFAIAAEVFRTIPRLRSYGKYPKNTRFGPFHIDFNKNLSEMVTETKFYYSNDTQTMPPDPQALEHIVGCGSSPVIRYAGTGAYFLDRVARGIWQLELYPDAVWVSDPHSSSNFEREVSRVLWRKNQMQITLLGLGRHFQCKHITGGSVQTQTAKEGEIQVEPGVYLLQAQGSQAKVASLPTIEYYAPHPHYDRPALWLKMPSVWREGCDLKLEANVATSVPNAHVVVHLKRANGGQQTLSMSPTRLYHYIATAKGEWLQPGPLHVWAEVKTNTARWIFPPDAEEKENVEPFTIFTVDPKIPVPRLSPERPGGYRTSVQIVQGERPAISALQLHSEGFGPSPSATGCRVQTIAVPARLVKRFNTIGIRARAIEPLTDRVEFGFVQRDGSAFGGTPLLWSDWHDVRLNIRELHPLWNTKQGTLNLSQLTEMSLVFGAWLYGENRAVPHGFEIERVWLEQSSPCWTINIQPEASSIELFYAGRHRVRHLHASDVKYATRLVRGSKSGRRALRVATQGFGQQPSCISFRITPGEELRPWREVLAKCDAVRIVARAGHPATNAVEIVLLEEDGSPWGTVVELKRAWTEKVLPLNELRYFRHWRSGPPSRGQENDHFQPENAAGVNICFGAWLYPGKESQHHAIEIESVSLLISKRD